MSKRCQYHINRVVFLDKIIYITDECNGSQLSVTNDAERVCEELNKSHPGFRIIYKDTNGDWDEIVHVDGVFQGFRPVVEGLK